MTTTSNKLLCFLLIATACITWAFHDPYAFDMKGEPPGTINVTGVAGGPRVFEFTKWQINKLTWTPGDFENIEIEVLIDCKSLTHDLYVLVYYLKKIKDYFFFNKFPTALAAVRGATMKEDGSYSAMMELSLKGVTKEVPITFEVTETAPYTVVGSGELNRRKFKFNGGGPENEVPLDFEIRLPQENI